MEADLNFLFHIQQNRPREVIKPFPCSSQPGMQFQLLIKTKNFKNEDFFLLSNFEILYLSC